MTVGIPTNPATIRIKLNMHITMLYITYRTKILDLLLFDLPNLEDFNL